MFSITTVLGLVLALVLGTLLERSLRRRVGEAMRQAQQLGQYTLEEQLGEGGMGTVYRARHELLRRPTAIKLIKPEREGDEEAILRFEREVQITAQLTHPNTVAIYDYGRTGDGVFYYAMEYFDGVDIKKLVKAYGPVPPERTVYLLRQVCGSLGEAHDFGLIHRDIKPENIMLCERGGRIDMVKVLDFGMVKNVSMGGSRLQLTHADVVLGTPMYLSPEAISKKGKLDGRSDLYAVGAVAYFMLTGRYVFVGDNPIEIVEQHQNVEPTPPSAHCPSLPQDLEQVVLDCLKKDPAQRPRTAHALIDRLNACACANQWNQRRAREWWKESGESPGSLSPWESTPTEDVTLSVDMQKR